MKMKRTTTRVKIRMVILAGWQKSYFCKVVKVVRETRAISSGKQFYNEDENYDHENENENAKDDDISWLVKIILLQSGHFAETSRPISSG